MISNEWTTKPVKGIKIFITLVTGSPSTILV